MVDVLLRHKGEYHVYFYMAPPLNESMVTVRTERRRTCKLYIRYCFSSHSPALPNVCSLYHIMLLSFVLFARDTHNNHDDWIINDASYYLELSAVYGYNQATHDTVHDKSKGRGLLYPDAFAEDHLLFLPLPPSPSISYSRGTTTSFQRPFSRSRSPSRWSPVGGETGQGVF